MKTEKEIKKEISNFIKNLVPDTARYILIHDYKCIKVEIYRLFNFEFPMLIERIYDNLDYWADMNECEDCQTVEGLWNYCKLTNGFGEICHLYYSNENGDFIKFGYGNLEEG